MTMRSSPFAPPRATHMRINAMADESSWPEAAQKCVAELRAEVAKFPAHIEALRAGICQLDDEYIATLHTHIRTLHEMAAVCAVGCAEMWDVSEAERYAKAHAVLKATRRWMRDSGYADGAAVRKVRMGCGG